MSGMTDPRYRERISPEVIIGRRINAVLGEVTPDQAPFLAAPSPFYHYHPGDVFFPGAAAWVLDQKTETPLMCQWGSGLLLRPNRGFQAYPPIPPLQTPANLVRVATPWGTFSTGWAVPVVQEFSGETQDTAGFTPLANVDFAVNAPPGTQQSPVADYGSPPGAPNAPFIPALGAASFGAYPTGVTSAPAFQDAGIYLDDGSQGSYLPGGGSIGDY